MRDALGGVQSVLVLGAGSDIAMATVRRLVQGRTRTVVLAARDTERMQPFAAELRTSGATQVDIVAFEATALGEHSRFVEEVFAREGDIDLVLLAFGLLGDQAVAEQDESAALDVITTNFSGAVSVAIPVVRHLRLQGHGSLVVLSTVAAERPRRSNFIYGASKAGMDAFFQGLSDSLAGTGIDVIVVRPGFVPTKMTAGRPEPPGGSTTTTDAVAAAIVNALGRGSGTVWVPSTLRYVMSAVRHLPRPLFRRLRV